MGVVTQYAIVKSYDDFGGFKFPSEVEVSSDMGTFILLTQNVSYDSLSENDFVSPE